ASDAEALYHEIGLDRTTHHASMAYPNALQKLLSMRASVPGAYLAATMTVGRAEGSLCHSSGCFASRIDALWRAGPPTCPVRPGECGGTDERRRARKHGVRRGDRRRRPCRSCRGHPAETT